MGAPAPGEEAVPPGAAATELARRIAATRAGEGDPAALLGEFRRTPVLVPLVDGGFWAADQGGIRWICAFTGEEPLARFAAARGGASGGGPDGAWPYQAVLGARLLDVVVPRMGCPAGVAVDVADEEGSMFFPPLRGIVPEAAALDAGPVTPEAGTVDGPPATG